MRDVTAPPPECAHKFRQARDGMLVCKECGFRMAPRTYGSDEIDTSRGAEYIKKQRRRDNFFSSVSEALEWLRWW
jgi:hypothetical protein